MLFHLFVSQEHMIRGTVMHTYIQIFPKLYISFRSQYECTAVTPGTESVRRKPVYPKVIGSPIIRDQKRITKIIQLRMLRIVVIGNLTFYHGCSLSTYIV